MSKLSRMQSRIRQAWGQAGARRASRHKSFLPDTQAPAEPRSKIRNIEEATLSSSVTGPPTAVSTPRIGVLDRQDVDQDLDHVLDQIVSGYTRARARAQSTSPSPSPGLETRVPSLETRVSQEGSDLPQDASAAQRTSRGSSRRPPTQQRGSQGPSQPIPEAGPSPFQEAFPDPTTPAGRAVWDACMSQVHDSNVEYRFFARLRSFDLACPRCGVVHLVRASKDGRLYTRGGKHYAMRWPSWEPILSAWRCRHCGLRLILGILAWQGWPARVGPLADHVPTVDEACRIREGYGTGVWIPATTPGKSKKANRVVRLPGTALK
jgi:hypothetical protein